MITVNNYTQQTANIDFSKAPEAIVKGKEFYEKANTMYGKSDAITKTIDLYIAKLNEYAAKENKPKPIKQGKGNRTTSSERYNNRMNKIFADAEINKAKIQTEIKNTLSKYMFDERHPLMVLEIGSPQFMAAYNEFLKETETKTEKNGQWELIENKKTVAPKKVVTKANGSAKYKAKSKKATPKTKVKVKVVKLKEPKPPITIKKLSLELQHIKRFASLSGKSVKVSRLKLFLATISKNIKENNYQNHRALITEIATRLDKAIEQLEATEQTSVNVKHSDEIKEKCKAAIANAKVRVRTEYLSGLGNPFAPENVEK